MPVVIIIFVSNNFPLHEFIISKIDNPPPSKKKTPLKTPRLCIVVESPHEHELVITTKRRMSIQRLTKRRSSIHRFTKRRMSIHHMLKRRKVVVVVVHE